MAATDVYASATRVPLGGKADDRQATGIIQATSSAFRLEGGLYEIEVIGSTFGSVTFQRLGPDGATYLTQATAITAPGTALVYCPRGQYRWAIA